MAVAYANDLQLCKSDSTAKAAAIDMVCGITATKTKVHRRAVENRSLEEAADNSPGREEPSKIRFLSTHFLATKDIVAPAAIGIWIFHTSACPFGFEQIGCEKLVSRPSWAILCLK